MHQYSGQRYPFLDDQGDPVSPGVARGQLTWLAENVVRSTPDTLHVPKDVSETTQKRNIYESPIKQWCESVRIRDVVGQYVKLNSRGVGHCPWPQQHKNGDTHASFQVFERTQKWWCYSEQVGGNVFDFLCRYHGRSPKEMLEQLGYKQP